MEMDTESSRKAFSMNVQRLKYPALIVATGLVIGLFSDLLVYDRPVGISYPIIMAVVVAGLLVLSLVEKTDIGWANLWLVVPLLYLAVMSAVRAVPVLRFMNIVGALLLLALLADRFASAPLTRLNLGGYVLSLLQTSMLTAVLPIPVLRRGVVEMQSSEEDGPPVTRRVLIGVLIALPFLCIFTLLFAAADLLFSSYLEDLLGDLTIGDIIGHGLLTLILAWILIGGLTYALTRRKEDAKEDSATEAADSKMAFKVRGALGTVEASIALFSIDALFAVFLAIQAAALFGGQAFLERKELTYAEYARQGFFQLLAVALITLALILALDYVTRRETTGQQVSFLAGSGLMIAMTIVILLSAFSRLQLYELAFGFTRLRLLTHVFMVWLAALMAFFLILLVVRRTRLFAIGVLVFVIGYTTTLNVINPDPFIVAHNLERWERNQELDIPYLGTLSADAIPYLMPLFTEYGSETRDEIGPWLRMHLDRLDRRQENAGWPSTHVSINRTYRHLDANRDLIETYDPAYRFNWD